VVALRHRAEEVVFDDDVPERIRAPPAGEKQRLGGAILEAVVSDGELDSRADLQTSVGAAQLSAELFAIFGSVSAVAVMGPTSPPTTRTLVAEPIENVRVLVSRNVTFAACSRTYQPAPNTRERNSTCDP
jgi:hypothetical protein